MFQQSRRICSSVWATISWFHSSRLDESGLVPGGQNILAARWARTATLGRSTWRSVRAASRSSASLRSAPTTRFALAAFRLSWQRLTTSATEAADWRIGSDPAQRRSAAAASGEVARVAHSSESARRELGCSSMADDHAPRHLPDRLPPCLPTNFLSGKRVGKGHGDLATPATRSPACPFGR